ncbi:MAG: hypothetical protein KAQ85_08595 [Thermodesulfovibrionia bacterium]|nr:hypothetical protein [Thermodesulfovibrionia bacterium]
MVDLIIDDPNAERSLVRDILREQFYFLEVKVRPDLETMKVTQFEAFNEDLVSISINDIGINEALACRIKD